MDLDTITITDFKTLFARDFPYLPEWSSTKLYNSGNVVYYSTTELFYQANQNGVPLATLPTDSQYWDAYSDDIYNYVLDADITKAFGEAQVNLNQALFSSDAQIQRGYLYLTAHYLCMDIRGAKKGLESTPEFIVGSRSVGSVSESYIVPDAYKDNPFISYLAKTSYGQKYLSLILPLMIGNFGVVAGGSRP